MMPLAMVYSMIYVVELPWWVTVIVLAGFGIVAAGAALTVVVLVGKKRPR
jgi:hypothetical protein